jgi:hypothetical protein
VLIEVWQVRSSLFHRSEQTGGNAWATSATTIIRRDIMRTSKLFLFAAAFVLLASFYTGAMAQDRMGQKGSIGRLPPGPIGSIVKVSAIEVTDGVIGLDNLTKEETAFGYAFLGQTTGDFPGSFTLSMNCTPAKAKPGEGNELTSGSWTLPVYITSMRGSSAYAGSLYGTIAKGKMNWDEKGTSANVYIVLNVDGGTQSWDGVKGYATFAGTLTVDETTGKTTLDGDMMFSIMSGVK